MTTEAGSNDDREVIPRWRPFHETSVTGELSSLSEVASEDISAELDSLREAFKRDRNAYTGGDLLSALIADGGTRSEIEDLARDMVQRDDAPTILQSVAKIELDRELSLTDTVPIDVGATTIENRARARIAVNRKSLTDEPRNAIRWVDLALAHVTLGQPQKAVREVLTALKLAPDSRFVLRAASRLFVHVDDPERAQHLLSRSARLKFDPWLLAAELAVSQLAFGRFKNERAAREILVSQDLPPLAISELASELATDEVRSGRDRRARVLFAQAFIDPTENAVAQATSLADRGDLRLDPELLNIKRGYEARAINFARAGDWASAAREGKKWQSDQPFAIQPALFASHAASLGAEDYMSAFAITRAGLLTHESDPMLNNNAAFALANMDRTVEARGYLQIAKDAYEQSDSGIYDATVGLVSFREGDILTGRAQYEIAISKFEKAGRKDLVSTARGLWALEEIRAQTDQAAHCVELFERAAKVSGGKDIETLNLRIVERRLRGLF